MGCLQPSAGKIVYGGARPRPKPPAHQAMVFQRPIMAAPVRRPPNVGYALKLARA